ncbi:hypothetical protein K458DRAFT_198476 [Lentithecium fluviatile CBS 122367]|uniref:Mediator of RNA polymerase II transcription subunit 16 n=1 Tax=Lentithecium fluviatile CBS 122367 TaxID=1168545 RepID=A0A6G1J7T5_9PLEO|nr:hypothetical protein K458DRAFT_198476 [Lentithecium fluviatile CBS 122367]
MIMEDLSYDNMDDDLFGDSVQVALPHINTIPAPPPVKGLAGRLDELSASGCCSRIAWSKNGCVAYIGPGGKTVNLKVFSRDSSSGKRDLGPDTPVEIPSGHNDYPFVHLSWSHLGNDLVIINSAGHVLVFSCAMALDRMSFMRAESGPPESDMDAVVGMHWLAILPYEQKNQIAWAAKKDGDMWRFHIESHKFRDMHHPAEGKASMIYLKRFGELKLRFQQADNSWSEVIVSLAPLTSTKEVFTHGAFASNNDDTLLLAAHDVAGRLHLYRIEATWKIPPQKPGQPPPKHYDKPDVQVSEITVDDNCRPLMVNNDLSGGTESRVNVPSQLTHLSFLPTTPKKTPPPKKATSAENHTTPESDDPPPPTIQAIFSTPPEVVAFTQAQPPQNPFSIVARWEVHQQQQNQLHPSLDKVTSKKKSVGSVPPRNVWVLRRQPDTMMHSVVLSFTPLWYHMTLGFCYSDGTIEFRKRTTMARIEPDYNSETVVSMAQAGFAFTNVEPSLHIALSPNYCMAASMQQEGNIKLRSMEYTYGSLATDEEDPRHSAALAALILQSTTAANQYFCSDDIFAVMGELSDPRASQFISLMFDALNVNLDCGVDENSSNHLILLGRSPFFVKTLSAIHVMGLQGSVNRSLTSKMAWIILNIKYVTQILTTIARMHGQIEKNPLRPEVVPQFIGICRWIMHFMIYIIDELVETGRSLQTLAAQHPTGITREILQQHIHDTNKPALLILLSSFPRMMLKLWAQPLQWVTRTAHGYINGNPTSEIRKLYHPLHQALFEPPLDWRAFEALVAEAQHLVRACYKPSASEEDSDDRKAAESARRNLCERDLLLGRIPDVLFPAAKRLVTETVFGDASNNGCLVDRVDMAKLMFFDTTWLGFSSSKRANNWFSTHVVDVCQKMIIRGTGAQSHPSNSAMAANQQSRNRSDSIQSASGAGAEDGKKKKQQLRRCVRCGAYMEDVLVGMPGYSNHHISWLMGVAKHCVCGNSWILAPEKKNAK